ncbi:hypothetical protein ALI144C_37910 [Actinosynnema sp. ALI-1.44]|uniref:hypothetical protein n=1 Tax=Actinosynnema sp. ALI-1.44 TaxID=1933779 RepID=UPI00097C9BEE|nr:hypothetical protein [Actinosynnema sp. ALI-1.44]ONI74619.1 hypothetical protein ALI144C_37910 [Actinosynnema sp. ALI-1.44]
MVRKSLTLATTAFAVLALATPASAAPGSGSHNGRTLSASNATDLDPAGETITVTGTGYDPKKGYYVALCQVPDDFRYGDNPTPCQGGDGQGGSGVGPSAWVTNTPIGTNPSTPIAADGSFTTQIRITQSGSRLDCTQVTCAIVSKRDHIGLGDRSFDVFIPVSWS